MSDALIFIIAHVPININKETPQKHFILIFFYIFALNFRWSDIHWIDIENKFGS